MSSPKPPPLPKRASSSPAPHGPGETGDGPPKPPPPPERPDTRTPDLRGNPAAEAFLERARLILAQESGLSAKAQVLLEQEARERGLTPQEAAVAVRQLRDGPPLPDPRPPGASTKVPLAPPIQAPPAASLQTVFLAYVREALARSSKPTVSARKEQRLIDEGTRKLGLSGVLARQTVHQVTAELGRRLASQDAASHASDQEEDQAEPPGLAAFLERAAAILTEQRGINARSRVLLSAAASEFGLTDSEMERGIAALKAAAPDTQPQDAWQSEREQSFCDYLQDVFAALPHRVATAQMEQAWIEAGEQRHGLQRVHAERVVNAVAAGQSVRVITEDQAMEHVRGLVDELLETPGPLNEQLRSRVFTEGGQWGLTPLQVDAILRERTRAKRRAAESGAWLPGLIMAGSLAGLLAVIGSLVWWFVFRKIVDRPAPAIRADVDQPAAEPRQPATIESPADDQWWAGDEDLLIAVTQTRAVVPEMKPVLAGLSDDEPDARTEAYAELVRMAGARANQADQRAVLQELVAGCFAVEPSEQCAAAIAEHLMRLVPAVGDDLPGETAGYNAALWALRTVATAATRSDVPQSRRSLLATEVERRLGWTMDLSLNPLELQTACLQAGCRHLYRVTIAAASQEPLVARPLFEDVTRQAGRYLDQRTIEQASVDFLAAALPAAGESWREFAALIQRCVDSTDPLIVLRMLEVFEQLEDTSLQAFLADRLLRRAGVFPQSMSPEEVAGAVRRALGADQMLSPSGRRDTLTPTASELLRATTSVPADREEVLRQIVRLAHAETMACALAQGAVGEATFDALDRDGPARLDVWRPGEVSEARGRRPERKAAEYQRDNVRRYIQYLLNPRSRVIQRNVFLRSVANLASQVPDLDAELAEQLAGYLLRPKPDDEHAAMLEHVAAIGRWKSLRLALADQLLDTQLQADRGREILAQILPRRTDLPNDLAWREVAHEMLLESVLQEMALPSAENDVTNRFVDELADALRELYVIQARLLGVQADEYAAAATPGDVLHLIVQTYADRLASGQLTSAARDDLQNLPYRFDAAQYVARNDLERFVLLQRLWVRTLAAGIERDTPDRAARARGLVRELEESDAAATDLFAQLHAGHRALLQLWLADEIGEG